MRLASFHIKKNNIFSNVHSSNDDSHQFIPTRKCKLERILISASCLFIQSFFWWLNLMLINFSSFSVPNYRWNKARETIGRNIGNYTYWWSGFVDCCGWGSEGGTQRTVRNVNDRATSFIPARKKQLTAIFREWPVSFQFIHWAWWHLDLLFSSLDSSNKENQFWF